MPHVTDLGEVGTRYKVAVYVPKADVDKVKKAGEHKWFLHRRD